MPKIKEELSELSKAYIERGEVVSPLYDLVFKSLLMDPRCRDYLIDLISGVTGISKEKLQNLHFENTEHPITHIKEKNKTSDLIVSIKNNVINIEMNRSYYKGLFEKNTEYTNSIQNQLFHAGEEYRNMKKVILISFDNFSKFGEELITKFQIRDEGGKYIESEMYESYHINLEKIYKMYYNNNKLTRFEKELALLTMEKIKDIEKISRGDKIMENAKEKLIELTENTIFIGHYEDEKTKEWERKSQLTYAKEQGLKQGLEEGLEKGLEQGLKQGLEQRELEIARKMKEKNTDITFISEVTGLSINDIEKL